MVSTSVTGRRPETHRSIGSPKSEAESQLEGSNEEAIPSSLVGQARADAHDAERIPTLGRRDRAPPRRAAARAGDGQLDWQGPARPHGLVARPLPALDRSPPSWPPAIRYDGSLGLH